MIIIDIVIDEKKDEHEITSTKLFFDMLMMVVVTGRERDEKEWEMQTSKILELIFWFVYLCTPLPILVYSLFSQCTYFSSFFSFYMILDVKSPNLCLLSYLSSL